MKSRVGIQLKPDHPVFWGSGYYGHSLRREKPDMHQAYGCFALAYGFSLEHMQELRNNGMIETEITPDGSLWIYFVSDLSAEDAGRALQAMGRMRL